MEQLSKLLFERFEKVAALLEIAQLFNSEKAVGTEIVQKPIMKKNKTEETFILIKAVQQMANSWWLDWFDTEIMWMLNSNQLKNRK